MFRKKIFVFSILITVCEFAWSDCVINGVNYPEGSVVNGYTCENGEWKKSE